MCVCVCVISCSIRKGQVVTARVTVRSGQKRARKVCLIVVDMFSADKSRYILEFVCVCVCVCVCERERERDRQAA